MLTQAFLPDCARIEGLVIILSQVFFFTWRCGKPSFLLDARGSAL